MPNQAYLLDGLYYDELIEIIRAEFNFLVSEYNFKKPLIDKSGTYISISYRASNISIEPVVDFKYPFIDVYACKLDNGKPIDGYRTDKTGSLIQITLWDGLRFRKHHHDITPPDNSLTGKNYAEAQLKYEANCLRMYLPDLLEDSDELFAEMGKVMKENRAIREEREFYGKGDAFFQEHLYAEFIQHCDQDKYPLSPLWFKRLKYAKKQAA
jgi:hypothetical protein